jgi:hypothetical protein
MKPLAEDVWRVGVFEPNVNVVKTFHFPFLVSENAFRKAPDKIKNVLLFGAAHLAGDAHVESFLSVSNLRAANKVFVEHRMPVADVLSRYVDIVVTHQWENNLNYLYWDVLYSGHPLVHNATPIKHLGYYYPEFDPIAGGDMLLRAMDEHQSRPRDKRREELAFLWSLNPENPQVQDAHEQLLDALYG